MISHNFRCAAFGIFLLLLKGNRAAGTHCLLMAAPAGYNGAECYYVSACCYRHYDNWGITTPGQGINRHWASELSSRLECIRWWPCCRGLAFNGCRRKGGNSPRGKLRRPTPHTPNRHATVAFVSIVLQCPSFYCFLAARADARGKPISNPNATISYNFRRAAFGIFLLLLKGNRAAGTHCLLTAAPAGYNDAEC